MYTNGSRHARNFKQRVEDSDERHLLDDYALLSEVARIVDRSKTLEEATVNTLGFLFSARELMGAYVTTLDRESARLSFISKSDLSGDLAATPWPAMIATELLKEYPQLPDWPLELTLHLVGVVPEILNIVAMRIDPMSDASLVRCLILTFPQQIRLSARDSNAIEIAAAILSRGVDLDHAPAKRRNYPHESLSRFRLSERQIQIGQRILGGLTNREIAKELSLSAATIRYECVRLYERLGARNRASAAAILQNLFSGDHEAVTVNSKNTTIGQP